ncbi:unnamed protein product [Cylicocyclus nassatus]|uniref:Uncharacterized protein n=1 Tax=Cylicocyclus nassatus TaxID=53992 RepID=A0AA36MCV9_CYLNA|nr:unnamed protein product [Cylicocyclus nassatus]
MLSLYLLHSIAFTGGQVSASLLKPSYWFALHLAMVAERYVALWKRSEYETFGMKLGSISAVTSVAASSAATLWTIQSELSVELKPTCFPSTKSTLERLSVVCLVICGVNVGTLIGLTTLFVGNKVALRRKRYDLMSSYQLSENYSIIRLLLPLSIFQNICYAFFTIFGALLGLLVDKVDFFTFRILFSINYIVPFYTLISPIIILSITIYSKRLNSAKLLQATRQTNKNDELYFAAYSKMWK